MSFSEAVRTCLRKYATFSGRASRPEYWWFVLFLFLGSIGLSIVDGALFPAEPVQVAPGVVEYQSPAILSGLFSLATLVPWLAAGWRRMHDSGRSGLHLIYPLIVMVGIGTFAAFAEGLDPLLTGGPGAIFDNAATLILGLASIVFFLSPFLVIWWLTRPSEPGPNRFGPNPLEQAQ
jgi:uncharacterized membrane protein YhaH (DUF805 family)